MSENIEGEITNPVPSTVQTASATSIDESLSKKKESSGGGGSRRSSLSSRPPISRKLVRQATLKDMTNPNITTSEKKATAAITHTSSLILAHGQEYRFGDGIDCTRLFVEYEVKKSSPFRITYLI